MRTFLCLLVLLLLAACQTTPPLELELITTDIDHFWEAYDQIIATEDSTEQYKLLKELFLDKASIGQLAMIERRNYTPEWYLATIQEYPRFWSSIRENTLEAREYAVEIERGIRQLREWYPELRPAGIYFTVGCLRSNGTTQEQLVLIGSELAMADATTDLSEMPPAVQNNLGPFVSANPINDLVFLNVHEYVHTQQRYHGNDLLSQCVYEGIAEFVPTVAMGVSSPTPAIHFGPEHDDRIRTVFSRQLSTSYYMDWLYNNFNNEFEMRDLGYYVGYAIAERNFQRATEKKQVIKEMIELDYRDPEVVAEFVDRSGYFEYSVAEMRMAYQENQPRVLSLGTIENGSETVNPGPRELELQFSTPMDTLWRGFDYGPEGEATLLRIASVQGWDQAAQTLTVGVMLEPGRHYQMTLTPNFRTSAGVRLEPYLIEFWTKE
ncbi:MAG: hypothetical protein AAF433_03270 [Bacteroidota bacterium]